MAAAAGFGAGLWANSGRRSTSTHGDGYGSSRFATLKEIRAAGLMGQTGVVVGYAAGQPLRVRDRHVLLIGPSGSGKSILLRKTLGTNAEDSCIVLDLKKTLYTTTATRRARLTQGPVYGFDPVDGGDHLNPWDLIPWKTPKEVAGIQRVVEHLTYTPSHQRSDAGLYYLSEAQEALWATIPYVHYSGVEEDSPRGLRRFLSLSGSAIRPAVEAMKAFGHPTVHEWASQVAEKTTSVLDAIWSSARRWLMAWVDPTLSWNTRNTTIDLQAFQQSATPATLYLTVSAEDIQGRLRSLIRLFLDLISLRLCDRPELDAQGRPTFQHRVVWVLDDMAELGQLAMIDRLYAYLRGFGHYLLGGAQSFAQFVPWIGTRSAIWNNATAWVLYRPMDHEEAAVIETHLGPTTVLEPVARVSTGRRGGSKTMGVQAHRRPLMFADEIRHIGEDQLFLSIQGQRPMLVSRGPEDIAA